ncbi:flagellar hook-basal body protein [Kangiella sp. HZ709]|uniref:flagellar hook-basal body protein n=1 Tax=Kangiella sp. HZ709 TaxID=2666328 RepID=UPI0012AFCBDF|nr:flagellar hook basal-body protein [Kangiella sp. HZ709]MRX26858.1 flagellar hook-basal body complex protein [Kangiella sp. HZ709]
MPKVTEIIADSINADMKKFSNLSHNIANVNTAGFKAMTLTESESKNNATAPSLTMSINMEAGTIKKTERNLDFAILGSGFFQVLSEDGSIQLTRNGSFYLNNDFNLVTHNGNKVIGEQGPIVLDGESFSVDAEGNFIIDERKVNKFSLVRPSSPERLEYLGSSLYKLSSGSESVEDIQVQQGVLESSNVSSSAQMIELIQISRHMQSNQKALMAYDQLLNTGINTLGQR